LSVVIYITALTIGLAAGSFLNVVVYRLPRGKSIVKPRSSCPQCGKIISWYENIPIVSYIFLRGRCSRCKNRISLRYPLVELLSGGLAVLCVNSYGLSLDLVFAYPFVMSLLAITLIDWDHQIIPDSISVPFIAAGVLWAVVGSGTGILSSLLGVAAGGGSLYLIGAVYQRIKGIEGMGGGDVKLMAMIGAFLGIKLVLPVILVASFFGALYGIILIYTGGDGLSRIPFGSFLAPAAALCLFAGEMMVRWYFMQFG